MYHDLCGSFTSVGGHPGCLHVLAIVKKRSNGHWGTRDFKLWPCGNLEGWDAGRWEGGVQDVGDTCIPVADSGLPSQYCKTIILQS